MHTLRRWPNIEPALDIRHINPLKPKLSESACEADLPAQLDHCLQHPG